MKPVFLTLLIGGMVALFGISGCGTNIGHMLGFEESVDMGGDQKVVYERGATREDAQRLGEALIEAGWFDDTMPATVIIGGPDGDRDIAFFVEEGSWDNEIAMLWRRELVQDIAPAIGGKHVTIRLLDQAWNERKRLQVELKPQPSVDLGHGQLVWYFSGATREDAQRLGEALIEAGWFDGTPVHVIIAGLVGDREITFDLEFGASEDESAVQWFRDLGDEIAPAIGGKPFTIRLLDGGKQKRLHIE